MSHPIEQKTSRYALARLSVAALCILGSASCATSPTGRRQFIVVPESQMDQLGVQSFEQLKQQTPATQNPALANYVNCVAQAIVARANVKAQWEIVVFAEDKTVNAFALPGGKIGVYSGLLPVAKTPGELAAVLGHEVSHVVAHHGAERVSQQEALNLTINEVGSLMGNPTTRTLAIGALGAGSQVGVLLPFSRLQESEADKLGQKLMADAGFDPHESLTLWQNMAALGGAGGPAILSDHPTDGNRLKALQDSLDSVMPLFEQAKVEGRIPICPVP
ncbi:MAG: peptidase [Myxococcaceae bacterium]|nr:peptidase [Myxococcaceae bacterium]